MTLDDVVILSDQQVKGIYYDVYNGFWKRYSKAVPSWQSEEWDEIVSFLSADSPPDTGSVGSAGSQEQERGKMNNSKKISVPVCCICQKVINGDAEWIRTKRGTVLYMHKECVRKEKW